MRNRILIGVTSVEEAIETAKQIREGKYTSSFEIQILIKKSIWRRIADFFRK